MPPICIPDLKTARFNSTTLIFTYSKSHVIWYCKTMHRVLKSKKYMVETVALIVICSAGIVIGYYALYTKSGAVTQKTPSPPFQENKAAESQDTTPILLGKRSINATCTDAGKERLPLRSAGVSYVIPPGYQRLDSIYFEGSPYGPIPAAYEGNLAILTRSTDDEVQRWRETATIYWAMQDIAPPKLSNGKTIVIEYSLQDPGAFHKRVEEKQSISINERSTWQNIESCGGLRGIQYHIGRWGGTAGMPRYVTVFPFKQGSVTITIDSLYVIKADDIDAYSAVAKSLQSL